MPRFPPPYASFFRCLILTLKFHLHYRGAEIINMRLAVDIGTKILFSKIKKVEINHKDFKIDNNYAFH